MSALFTRCPGGTVQTGTGKVDPARKFKCTTTARGSYNKPIILLGEMDKKLEPIIFDHFMQYLTFFDFKELNFFNF